MTFLNKLVKITSLIKATSTYSNIVSYSNVISNTRVCPRSLPTIFQTSFPMSTISEMPVKSIKTSEKEIDIALLNSIYPQLLSDLTADNTDEKHLTDVNNWLKNVLDYNVCGGKMNRSLTLMQFYRNLTSPYDLTEESLKKAGYLGWCLEILQAYFLVLDDIMDESSTRRGKPCWYKKAGLIAINDGVMMDHCIYTILQKQFKKEQCYVNLMELFIKTNMQTIKGQCLDMLSSHILKKIEASMFTEIRYYTIVKYKTAYYSFVLPAKAALYLAGINDETTHKKAEDILLKFGEYFQIQDDYLDCYGDPEVIGKIGTDIEDGKCCWLIVKALQVASKDQIDCLMANYGKKDPKAVEVVKQIYKELDLQKIYADYEENVYKEILDMISAVEKENVLFEGIFNAALSKIYKRKK